MTPEKAIAILEGKIPHREPPAGGPDETKTPVKSQFKDTKKSVDPDVNSADESHPFVGIFVAVLFAGVIAVVYLYGASLIKTNLVQINHMRQDLAKTKQNLELVNRQKEQLAQSLKEAKRPIIKKIIVLKQPVQAQINPNPLNSQDQAMLAYNKAIQLNPDDISAYLNRGLAYEDKGNNSRAISDFNKAIEISPGLMQAYTARGSAYEATGNFDQAIADFNQAIKISPQYALCFYRLGEIYFRKGKPAQAFSYWKRAIKLDSKNTWSRISYYSEGDHDKVISDNTRVIKVYPDFPLAYFRRGAAYAAKGYHDKAIADLSRAIELNPKYIEAYNDRAIAYFFKHDYGKAWDDVQEVLKLGGAVNVDFKNSLKIASGKAYPSPHAS